MPFPYRRLLHALTSKLEPLEPRGDVLEAARSVALIGGYAAQRRLEDAERITHSLLNGKERTNLRLFGVSLLFRVQKKTWQELGLLEELDQRLRSEEKDCVLLLERMGRLRLSLGRYQEALEAFERALRIRPRKARLHYRRALALLELDRIEEAKVSLLAIETFDRRAARLSYGIYFEEDRRYRQAAEAFEEARARLGESAALLYRLGRAYQRAFDVESAAKAFEDALRVKGAKRRWNEALAQSLEMSGRFEDAARAYQHAARALPHRARSLRDRAALSLVKTSEFEEASKLFSRGRVPLRAFIPPRLFSSRKAIEAELAEDFTRSELHETLGDLFYRSGKFTQASEAYRRALERRSDRDPALIVRLGLSLHRSARYQEACEFFARLLPYEPELVPLALQFRFNPQFHRNACYAEACAHHPLRKRTILYESFHGRSASCNPYAIFLAIVDRPGFEDFTHIFSLNDASLLPAAHRRRKNVIILRRESPAFREALATAEYLINNTSFPPYFSRRDGQKYLNTWHGTPFKALGRDERNDFFPWRNIARNFLHTTHLLSSNPHTTRVLLEQFQVRDLYRGKILEIGYPRIDRSLCMGDEERRQIRERFGAGPSDRLVLFAPTFRGTVGAPTLDLAELERDLNALLALPIRLVFRGHYFVENAFRSGQFSDLIAPDDLDTNALLAAADFIISDYSSLVVDALVLKKKLLLYVLDFEAYHSERGLYFELDELPGEKARTRDELVATLRGLLEGNLRYDEARDDRIREQLAPHEDGASVERLIPSFFHAEGERSSEASPTNERRPSILFYGGTLFPHGITAALVNLIERIDPERFDIALLLEPSALSTPERRARFDALPKHVRLLAFQGPAIAKPNQRAAFDHLRLERRLESADAAAVIERLFQNEARRTLGDAQFDYVIDYDGYSLFFASLLAQVGHERTRRLIYQHNDMFGEWNTKYPSLPALFHEYRHYDAIVSVSRSTRDVNFERLAKRFDLEGIPHVFAENLIDLERITRGASERLPEEDAPLFHASPIESRRAVKSGEPTIFINVGRLSPEKGQDRLIEAFSCVHREHPNTRLLLIGEGPLRSTLTETIQARGLSEAVRLLGWRANPFAYMARSDCFILSSRHEGQGLVLLEAMTLGLPTIAADIPCIRDVLQGRGGLIVSDHVEGLTQGMRAHLEGRVARPRFDAERYLENALKAFYAVLEGDDEALSVALEA